jgi:CDP-glycerol glycerophosphotransferase (TagB/SpsB family)
MSNYLARRGIRAYDQFRARLRAYADSPAAANTPDESALDDGLLPGLPDIVVHFPGPLGAIYQIEGWIPVLEALNLEKPVTLVVRHPTVFDMIKHRTSLPVVYARRYPVFAAMVQNSDPKLILYVHHRRDNYQSLRFADSMHIHLGHGESDKIYMASNQTKAYDRVLVAGDAAVDRLETNLLGFDTSSLVKIGRPQFDVRDTSATLPARATILYAPTYEGDIEGMKYTSVDSFGETIVRSIMDAPGLDIIYRPHPYTGRHDLAVRESDRRIREMIEASEHTGRIDTDTPFTDLMGSAHLLVADVSAVVVDFLETDRPYMVTDPGHVTNDEEAESALGAGYVLTRDNVDQIVPMIQEALESDPYNHHRARWRTYHFGDYRRGESLAAFERALGDAMDDRDRLVTAKRERLSSGGSRPRLPDAE